MSDPDLVDESSSGIRVVVRTPERLIKDVHAESVVLPTIDGETAVYHGHAPIFTVLSGQDVRVTLSEENEEKLLLPVESGVAEVFQNTVTILAHAVRATDENADGGDA